MDERTKSIIGAIAVIVVFLCSLAGVNLSTDAVFTGLSGLFAFITLCVTIWKNFPFTKAAIEGQKVINHLKAEEIAKDARGDE